ncbi:hypothetical protein [Rhodoblastus sp.]|jgi:hypothetical protein|uniref:hypothetical protein n=1 Tax=Rhodoblastus sp. TaxID=1962975 RepID=UPI00261AE42F|nr:hypothetical protein [Rhodoblastus sp.]
MVQRQQRSQSELEELCLMALQARLGVHHLRYVRIRPYFGPEAWTWEVGEVGPAVPGRELSGASDAVRALQQNFDLKPN